MTIEVESVILNGHYEVWSPFDSTDTANALLKILDEAEHKTDDKAKTGFSSMIVPKTPLPDCDLTLSYRPDDVHDGGINCAKR